MIAPKQWKILSNSSPKTSEQIVSLLLENRHVLQEDKEAFLHPMLETVTPAFVDIDENELAKTIKRLQKAKENKEKVVIFGDYDVDGITSTAILWETFHAVGMSVIPYIPSRVDEGYGLSIKGIEHVLEAHPDTKLIVTVDNGIVAHASVDFAKKKGIEVIITDHHVRAETLPDAFSIVHTTDLCGAGVAWMVSRAFKKTLPQEIVKQAKPPVTTPDITTHLDLVALATIADLVPLTGANRIVVIYGLTALRRSKRDGLIALCAEAGIEQEKITVYDIGHTIGPRLNAMGRMASAMDSLRLVCTTDSMRAKALAEKLGITNKERQEITFSLSNHAKDFVTNQESLKKLLVIYDESYEEGVIGLIAGKLVESFYRPAIVISKGEKVSKASARSIAGFNIIEHIRTASHLLLNAGGHPMAAGFSLLTEHIEKLQEVLERLAEEVITEEMLQRTLLIDCELSLAVISQEVYHAMQSVSPFGMKNSEPVFVSYGVPVRDVRLIGKEKNHLKLKLGNLELFDAIAFNRGEFGSSLHAGDVVDVVYTIDENTWNNKTSLQLKVKDVRMSSLPKKSGGI